MVAFVDIAGSCRRVEGQGLGNKFLATIRETNANCQVVHAFSDATSIHVNGPYHPADDIETINTELVLADLQTMEDGCASCRGGAHATWPCEQSSRRSRRRRRCSRPGGTISAPRQLGESTSRLGRPHLLTAKPFIYVFNVDEAELGDVGASTPDGGDRGPAEAVVLYAQVEAELGAARRPRTRPNCCAELRAGASQGSCNSSQVGFGTLGLQTFLTAGPEGGAGVDDPPVGDTAPEAAGVIHTDFQRGFIKAEIVVLRRARRAGSIAAARSARQARIEGKDYVMADGDVVEFRFNV